MEQIEGELDQHLENVRRIITDCGMKLTCIRVEFRDGLGLGIAAYVQESEVRYIHALAEWLRVAISDIFINTSDRAGAEEHEWLFFMKNYR